jgi:DNA-binding MarR family transcriptional regulator
VTQRGIDGCPEDDVRKLQVSVQAFVRSFGLLVTKQTPCGQPVSPSHAHALMILLEREELGLTTTQADLGRHLGLDKSNVARLCARLASEEHATQQVSPSDARSRQLTLSARGRRMATNIRAASLERFRRVMDAVPAAERRSLIHSVELLTAAVQTLQEPVT